MYDHIHLADIGEKLISKTFSFMSPLHKSGDIDEFNRCRNQFLCLRNLRQRLNANVWNLHHSHIGLDGAKRKIRAINLLFGERFKKGRFTHVWKSDNTDLKHKKERR